MNYFILISCIIVVFGFLIMMIGGSIFYLRAISNKRAWDGKTKPFLKVGGIVALIGIVMLAVSLWLQMK